MKLYIAYGSNINLKQMEYRCPKSQVYGKYELDDYKITFKGRGHANIEKDEGGSLPILIWKITEECEKELDKYEGYPDYYTKKELALEIDDKILKALVYVMTKEKEIIREEPSEEYLNTIREGYIDNKIDPEILDEFYERSQKE